MYLTNNITNINNVNTNNNEGDDEHLIKNKSVLTAGISSGPSVGVPH